MSHPDLLNDLAAQLGAMGGTALVLLGDVMLDRYLSGRVERISPEAPIPILKVERERASLGGAGNVLANLAALSAKVRFFALVGEDAAGAAVERLTGGLPQVGGRLFRDAGRPTTVKERFLADGQQLLRADRDGSDPPAEATLEALESAVVEALPGAAALILSDYGKGSLRPEGLRRVIAAARKAGVPVVVDPKGRDYSRYRGAGFVTPNRRELAEASGLPTEQDAEVIAAARHVIAHCGIAGVLATLSERGMLLVTESEVFDLPAEAREVFDVSGAGDTVVAVFALALGAGIAAPAAAGLANIAAGVVVGKRGTAVAERHEILRAAQAARLNWAESKLLDRAGAAAQARAWREAGLTVGFTNGCFDLLHPGHLSLLRQARAACDRLVVGLNSDASVKRLKGPSRPVQEEAARAAVLASLADVDCVVIFAEDTPLELLAELRPDLLVKGADYSREQVVGGELVESYGGRVLLAELLPGHSTTATLSRLAT